MAVGYAGDLSHQNSSGSATVTVAKRTTSTAVSCGALAVGVAASCTATVTRTESGTERTPTGTGNWTSRYEASAFAPPGTCALTPTATTGVASCSVGYTPGTAGSATISAAYPGDLTHQNSSGSATVTVAKRTTSTAVSCGALAVGVAASCTATVTDTDSGTKTTPTGTVNWSSSDAAGAVQRSEEHTSELQSPCNLVCRLLLEKKKTSTIGQPTAS